MSTSCPGCSGKAIRTFSRFNEVTDEWEWWKGCNECNFEKRDKEEEKLHPEYFTRTETSPAKINSRDHKPNKTT